MSSPVQDPRYREKQPFFDVLARYGCSSTGVAFDAAWLRRPFTATPAAAGRLPLLRPQGCDAARLTGPFGQALSAQQPLWPAPATKTIVSQQKET